MLQPTLKSPERILSIGGFGSGKSHAWLSIAQLAQATGSPAKFYVLDTDFATERMLETAFDNLNNIELTIAASWQKCEEFAKLVTKPGLIKPRQDWIVVDMIDITWSLVQSYFTDEVFGEDIGQYFLEARKAMGDSKKGGLSALNGWTDWQVINKLYQSFINRVFFEPQAHLYLTAKADAIDAAKDSPEIISTYGAFGIKPSGQKAVGNQVQTVMLFKTPKFGDWRISTIKDRGRAYFTGDSLTNFATQYLVDKAGWTF